ncbi:phospholipase D-like domain-containing protein [Streptomyces sp. DSM 41527]|uniref:Phospholipase D-like domain-containing protein n=1 Tax=Streptomyces mooreae TaxID=3075523 RepID=A0ABU2TJJ2_9ACTN|nr:phospholipase D-like domain-containing protein [Streptomyces sp. DSM 41527]MDT0461071.1 phospholipase D-like domain-containing protein [Streptomyces sp. DSM 41527]
MAPQRLHRLHRLIPASVALTTVCATLPASAAYAADTPPTPHLDSIERSLRETSPGLEGSVWERTDGNRLDAPADNPSGWLLQTPGCWGDAGCKDRVGTRRLLDKMTRNIADARHTVDISSLAPFPNGGFEDAVVAGLKASVKAGHSPRVRILVGAAPIYHLNVVPSRYRDDLIDKLGPDAGKVTLNVASMTTSKTSLSWNHSKLLVVDGKTAVTGGINGWKDDYLDTDHPVSDVDMALSGPAARSAGKYLDTLWDWTCRNASDPAKVWLATSNGSSCMPSMEKEEAGATPAGPTGDVPVIAVGGLGVGIKESDPSSGYHPDLPTAPDTKCTVGLHDHTNGDRDYDTVNPEENALRSLIASARSHVEISQQDLNGTCPPLPRYDIRTYDTLAGKLAAGVKVRIVVSDPANRGAVGSGGYSQIKSLDEISDTLRTRLVALTGDNEKASRALCGNLQLASFRSSDAAKWADGKPYALHHKLVSVDDSAFYIGSKNLYPAWLQDFGYIVESPAAAKQLKTELLDPEWKYSQQAASTPAGCPAGATG